MEEPQPNTPDHDFSSTVDTSRPFTSVKEAVAIFGERLLAGEFYSPKPSFSDTTTSAAYSPPTPGPNPIPISIQREPSWRLSSPSPSPTLPPSPMKPKGEGDANDGNNNNGVLDTLKKLEAELENTKAELKLLKERGSETEVALATLNAELHKNMSKLAQAEAAAAGKAAAATKTVRFEINERENKGGDDRDIKEEEKKKKKKEYISRMEDSKTLAQILSLGENDHLFGGGGGGGKLHKRKNMKHKPIIPLVGDLFFKRKASSTNHHNPLFASPF